MHVRNLLQSMEHMFTRVPDWIMYFYNHWQPIFSEMQKDTFEPGCCRPKEAPPESYQEAPLPEQWGGGGGDQFYPGMKRKRQMDDYGEEPGGKRERLDSLVAAAAVDQSPSRRKIVNEWINELPTVDLLRAKSEPFKEGNGILCILDDYMQQVLINLLELILEHKYK